MGIAGCGTTSIIGRAPGVSVAFPLRCHSWSCPRCAPPMRRRLTALAAAASPTTMLTLTASVTAHRTPAAAFHSLRQAWPRFVHRLRRLRPNDEIAYLWVWETTAAGYPHLHVLLRAPYIPHRWISRTWATLARSPVVDIRAVRGSDAAAHYVAKYLTKRLDAPPGYRRWGASPGFLPEAFRRPPPDQPSPFAWEWSDLPLAAVEAAWRALFQQVAYWPEDLLIALSGASRSSAAVATLGPMLAGRSPPAWPHRILNGPVLSRLTTPL